MKRSAILSLAIMILAMCSPSSAFGGKTVKIKLTGTCNERIMMTVGNQGRTEIITGFPYTFEVPKDQMPVRLTFNSDNYVYYNIDVPKKPYDTTGHVYLVKINESAMYARATPAPMMAQQAGTPVTASKPKPIMGLDVTKGVNAAPVTGAKNENTLALIIANEEYEMVAKVDNATNDGLAFKEYCIKTLGIPSQNVKYHSNLSFGKMRKALADIVDVAGVIGEDVNLLVYYAGHGIPDNKTKNAFLMPIDSDGSDTDICFSLSDFYERLNSSSANRCVVFLDACFSGAQRDGEMIMAARGVKLRPQAAAPKGKTIVFSATSGEEAAYSYKDEEHGLFTYFLLKKLQESKGKATLGELADYLSKNVGVQSRLINNNPQTPTVVVAPAMTDSWRSIRLTK